VPKDKYAVHVITTVLMIAFGRLPQGGLSAPAALEQRPAFRSGVEVVALSVSVVDRRHRFVSGLGRDDFVVYEDGTPRDVAFFGPAAAPVDVALLLDMSASMSGKMTVISDAAIGLIRTLRPRDRAAVIGFANHVTSLQPLTTDTRLLEDAVRRATPVGKTSLYDAL
jgi:Ca-activated chloride channel family protein